MKKIILLILVLLSGLTFAQEEGKVRVSLDLGYAIPSAGGGGISFYLEPMYNIKDNMSVGLRLGSAALIKEVELTNGEINKGELSANGSYMATFDYHLNGSGSSFVPFIGAGLGYVSLANISFDDNSAGVGADGKFGGMIRGGFELGKFRLGLDYNFIPKTDLLSLDGSEIGSSKNSYLGINIGFFVGGGKW